LIADGAAHRIEDDVTDDPTLPTPSDRFTGALLGLAIGDSLGMPTMGPRPDAPITGYEPLRDATGDERLHAGEFSSYTEFALCMLESIVSSRGFLDPSTAGYRFAQVLNSDNGFLVDATSRIAIERGVDVGDFQVGAVSSGPVEPGPAARIVPIALVHALGHTNSELFVREVLRATLLTHSTPEAVNGALAMAYALSLVVKREMPPDLLIAEVLSLIDEDEVAQRLRIADAQLKLAAAEATALGEIGTDNTIAQTVAAALYLFAVYQDRFESAVLTAANAGAGATAIAAMTGALSGAWVGAGGIPTSLVDGLEGRMYILMASPALFRTAQQRAGLFLQLHRRM
jgi:ADP-ribosylglycohydrolase